jgi:RNA polymerase sigma-70 factor (ECF subfamily)
MGRRSGTEEAVVSAASTLVAPVSGTREGVAPAVAARLSFREVFDEHASAVGRTLRYLGVPEAELTDAAQDVFLVVDRRYAEFEGRSTVATWIRQICVRVAFTYKRKRRRRREDVVSEPPEASIEADQHSGIERRQGRAILTRVLDTLDDDLRAVVVLHDIERMPMREVAEALGCPVQTAYSRRNAALEKMRRDLVRLKETP